MKSKMRFNLSRSLQRWLAAGCLSMMVAGSTGCSMTSGLCKSFNKTDCIDDFMISYRNRTMAEKAWHCNKHRFCDKRFMNEFKDGFMQGYAEVASGGNGCTPAVAPSEYWGWRYQSTQGQGAVNAWFEGFPMGVRAAEQDGIGHWGQIQTAGMMAPPPAALPVAAAASSRSQREDPNNPFYQNVPQPIPEPSNSDIEELDEDMDGETDEDMDLDSLDSFDRGDDETMELDLDLDDEISIDIDDKDSVFNAMPDTPLAGGESTQPEFISSRPGVAAKFSDSVVKDEGETFNLDEVFGNSPNLPDDDSDELSFSFE